MTRRYVDYCKTCGHGVVGEYVGAAEISIVSASGEMTGDIRGIFYCHHCGDIVFLHEEPMKEWFIE